MYKIVIGNRKGGCGKSCTAQNLSNWLVLQGYKVLLIDADNQSNTSYTMGYDTVADEDIITLFDVLNGDATLKEAIQPVIRKGAGKWDIVPAEEKMALFDNGIMPIKTSLSDALKSVYGDYDYCVIDTPLSKSLITSSALNASDAVIITCVAEIYSVQGAQNFAKSVIASKKYNPELKVSGILITRHNERLSIAKDISDMLESTAKMIGTKVFDVKIREGVAVREANAYRMGLFDYDTKRRSVASIDYDRFFKELILKGGK